MMLLRLLLLPPLLLLLLMLLIVQDSVRGQSDNNQDANNEWVYRRLDSEKYPLAQCLDGSYGAYYYRRGSAKNKVLLHFQGGGWCTSLQDPGTWPEGQNPLTNCVIRSDPERYDLGSTANDRERINKSAGYFSASQTENPAFYNWNVVFIRYCDGASFLGRRIDHLVATDTSRSGSSDTRLIYSRGNYILQAVIADLFLGNDDNDDEGAGSVFGSSTTHVVLAGSSAGALAVYLNAHSVRRMLLAGGLTNTKIAAVADAGFFLPYSQANPTNDRVFTETMKSVYDIAQPMMMGVEADSITTATADAGGALPPECIAEQPASDDYWNCMFAANAVPYMPVPVLIVQSRYDDFQIERVLGYVPPLSSEEEDAASTIGPAADSDISYSQVLDYGQNLTSQILLARRRQAQRYPGIGSSLFVFGCYCHVTLAKSDLYRRANVDGRALNRAVELWIADRAFSDAAVAAVGDAQQPQQRTTPLPSNSAYLWVSFDAYPCEQCCEYDLSAYAASSTAAANDGNNHVF